MAIIVKETTIWDGIDSGRLNHYYALTDDRRYLLGYLKADGSSYKMFSKPLNFDTRGRTFEVIQKVQARANV